jgi:hypothetical protein
MRREWIEGVGVPLAVSRQCALAGVARSWVYAPHDRDAVSEGDLTLLRLIDAEYTRRPFYGSRRRVVYHPPGARLRVSGGGDRRVLAAGAVLAALQHPGGEVLRGLPGGRPAEPRPARAFQQRPGVAVHQRCLHGHPAGRGDRHQHGRARPGAGQHLQETLKNDSISLASPSESVFFDLSARFNPFLGSF